MLLHFAKKSHLGSFTFFHFKDGSLNLLQANEKQSVIMFSEALIPTPTCTASAMCGCHVVHLQPHFISIVTTKKIDGDLKRPSDGDFLLCLSFN